MIVEIPAIVQKRLDDLIGKPIDPPAAPVTRMDYLTSGLVAAWRAGDGRDHRDSEQPAYESKPDGRHE
jgi:hypothetical protein